MKKIGFLIAFAYIIITLPIFLLGIMWTLCVDAFVAGKDVGRNIAVWFTKITKKEDV